MFKKASNYLQSVRTEMAKVNWPSRDQLVESTSVTLVLSMILALFVFAVDLVISRIINFII